MHLLPYHWLERNKDVGIFLLRAFTGIRLVYGVADNVLSWKHMQLFEQFLAANHFPLPIVSAVVSVYAQLICGIMIIVGYHIRIAALIMIFNFLVALVMVHRNDSFEGMTPALAMLLSCIVFLFYGPGRVAIRRT
jgi:putative oxidoreductase